MYLEKSKAKGNVYLYLKEYDRKIKYGAKKRTLYRFGRLEEAREDILRWKKDIRSLPDELKQIGCTQDDIRRWERRTLSIIQQKQSS